MGEEVKALIAPPATLTASLSTVSVSPGGQVPVTISGGTPPFIITDGGNAALCSAAFDNPDVTPATLRISGVSTSSGGSTRVKIKDSGHSPEQELEIDIIVTAPGVLPANPSSVTLIAGGAADVSISGGTRPYVVEIAPNSAFATALFVDASAEPAHLIVTALLGASGIDSVRVKDSSVDSLKRTTIPITIHGLLTASPNPVFVGQSQLVPVTIGAGTPPYVITVAPDPALIASALFANPNITPATLNITGVSTASVSGSTSLKVHDSSNPFREITVQITKNQ
jgi:hypothetical protein